MSNQTRPERVGASGAFRRCLLVGIVAAVLGASVAGAAAGTENDDAPRLTIGSPAPALAIEHWMASAAPITGFEQGRVYVVEFWATWCPPCLTSMPHLAELQEKYGDERLRIIGVSDEEAETVREFLKKRVPDESDQTYADLARVYSITTDPDQSVHREYMDAADQQAIPLAFIVGKTGHIEWMGGPMQLDEPLARVLDDTWDRQAFARRIALERASNDVMLRARELARQDRDAEAIAVLGEFLETTDDPVTVYRFSSRIQSLSRGELVEAGATALAVEKMRVAVTRIDAEFRSHFYDTLARLLYLEGKLDEAIAAQRQAIHGATPGLKPRFESFLQDLEAAAELAEGRGTTND